MLRRGSEASLTRNRYDEQAIYSFIPSARITEANPAQATLAYSRSFSHFALQLRGPFNTGIQAELPLPSALWAVVSVLTRPLRSLSYFIGLDYMRTGVFVKEL